MLFKEIICWDCGSMAVIRVDLPMSKVIRVLLIKITIMLEINIYGHHIDSFWLLNTEMLRNHFVSPKIGGFIHVQPYSRKRNFLI